MRLFHGFHVFSIGLLWRLTYMRCFHGGGKGTRKKTAWPIPPCHVSLITGQTRSQILPFVVIEECFVLNFPIFLGFVFTYLPRFFYFPGFPDFISYGRPLRETKSKQDFSTPSQNVLSRGYKQMSPGEKSCEWRSLRKILQRCWNIMCRFRLP